MKFKHLALVLSIIMAGSFMSGCSIFGGETTTTTVCPYVAEFREGPFDWTIMVYLDADNNLESDGIADFNEMEQVPALIESGVNVIVLMDRIPGESSASGDWTGTRLYQVYPDCDGLIHSYRLSSTELGLTATGGDEEELNMGDENTLSNFILYCENTFVSDKSMLVLWNHGGGWRDSTTETTRDICWDESSSDDFLYNSDVRKVLNAFSVDVIGFDACLMGMAEVAYEFKDVCDYLVGSPETEPGGGWEYNYWLTDFLATDLSATNLYTTLIDAYAREYASMAGTTLAAYDLSKASALLPAIEALGTQLLTVTNDWWSEWGTSHTNFAKVFLDGFYSTVDGYEHNYDLWEIADYFSGAYNPECSAIKTAVDNVVLYEWHNTSGSISSGNPNSHGMAVEFEPSSDYANDTRNLFTQAATEWNGWIDSLAQFPPYEFIFAETNYTDSLGYHESDYYQFYVDIAGTVDINLTVSANADDDIYLYNVGMNLENVSWIGSYGENESISRYLNTGWYIVKVNRWDALNTSATYTLTVSESGATLH